MGGIVQTIRRYNMDTSLYTYFKKRYGASEEDVNAVLDGALMSKLFYPELCQLTKEALVQERSLTELFREYGIKYSTGLRHIQKAVAVLEELLQEERSAEVQLSCDHWTINPKALFDGVLISAVLGTRVKTAVINNGLHCLLDVQAKCGSSLGLRGIQGVGVDTADRLCELCYDSQRAYGAAPSCLRTKRVGAASLKAEHCASAIQGSGRS